MSPHYIVVRMTVFNRVWASFIHNQKIITTAIKPGYPGSFPNAYSSDEKKAKQTICDRCNIL